MRSNINREYRGIRYCLMERLDHLGYSEFFIAIPKKKWFSSKEVWVEKHYKLNGILHSVRRIYVSRYDRNTVYCFSSDKELMECTFKKYIDNIYKNKEVSKNIKEFGIRPVEIE